MTLSEEEDKKTEELTAQGSEEEEKEAVPTSTGGEQRQEEGTKEFVCGICGKGFEKPESLKSHRLRSHRISTHVEVGQEGVSGQAPAPRVEESPPSTSYVTDRDLLFNMLKKLRYYKPEAVVDACDTRDYYITTVYSVLKEMGASEAVIKPVLAQWSHLKDQPIPYAIKSQLNIRDVYDDYQSRATGSYGGYDSYGYGYPARQHDGDILTGVGNLIRAIKEDGGLSQQGGGDNELITQLQGQVSNLQKELHELREDQTKKEVQGLKEEITELKKLLEKNSGDAQLNFLDKRFKQVGEKTDRLINVLDPISKAYGRRVYETYTGEPLPAPEREAQEKGRKGVMDLLPNELIEEEAQTEAGGEQT